MKTKTTHTPGPFPLHVETAGPDEPYVIVTNQGNHWATTHDPLAARLISAAPDLLSALRDGLDRISKKNDNGEDYELDLLDLADVFRLAIAKAEGK